jgi:hypothetical protein
MLMAPVVYHTAVVPFIFPGALPPFHFFYVMNKTTKVLFGGLLGGAATLSAVLAAAPAQAASCWIGWNPASADPECTPSTELVAGDKTVFNIDPMGFGPNQATDTAGLITFEETAGFWDLVIDFFHSANGTDVDNGSTVGFDGSLDYDITITSSDYVFETVALAQQATSPTNASTTVKAGTGFANLTVVGTETTGAKPIAGSLQMLSITDTFTAVGRIQKVTNEYTQASVPGPLPIMGAGVAFGYSRKLRRRVAAAKV